MPANTLSRGRAQQGRLRGKDNGTRWCQIPSGKERAHGAIPAADEDPTVHVESVPSSQQETAGQAGPGKAAGRGPLMADSDRGQSRCCSAAVGTVPRLRTGTCRIRPKAAQSL